MKIASVADEKLRSRIKEAGADDNADLMKGERWIPNLIGLGPNP